MFLANVTVLTSATLLGNTFNLEVALALLAMDPFFPFSPLGYPGGLEDS